MYLEISSRIHRSLNQLTANATLTIPYQEFPSGFATLTDTCELDDEYIVVEQVKSYVLQARSDDRFPIMRLTQIDYSSI